RTLVAAKEKYSILCDGTAQRPAKLIALDRVTLRGEFVSRIEDPVPHEFKEIAMKFVRSRFCHHADRSRRFHALLSGRGAGLDLELLKRVRKWQRRIPVVGWIIVIGAIQNVSDSGVYTAGDGIAGCRERIPATPGDERRGSGIAGKRDQVDHIASIEGQFHNAGVLDNLADTHRSRFDRCGIGLD